MKPGCRTVSKTVVYEIGYLIKMDAIFFGMPTTGSISNIARRDMTSPPIVPIASGYQKDSFDPKNANISCLIIFLDLGMFYN